MVIISIMTTASPFEGEPDDPRADLSAAGK